jgi:hypothetical protein
MFPSLCCLHVQDRRIRNCTRFEVLTAVIMKITAFWDAKPCSLIEVYLYFGGPCSLHLQVEASRRPPFSG